MACSPVRILDGLDLREDASMRNLMTRPAGMVSIWMSLAPIMSASAQRRAHRRTTSLDSSLIARSDKSRCAELLAGDATSARTASSAAGSPRGWR